MPPPAAPASGDGHAHAHGPAPAPAQAACLCLNIQLQVSGPAQRQEEVRLSGLVPPVPAAQSHGAACANLCPVSDAGVRVLYPSLLLRQTIVIGSTEYAAEQCRLCRTVVYAVDKAAAARRVSGFHVAGASPARARGSALPAGVPGDTAPLAPALLRPVNGTVWVVTSALDPPGIARALASPAFSRTYRLCLPPGRSGASSPRTTVSASLRGSATASPARIAPLRRSSTSRSAMPSSVPASREASKSPDRAHVLALQHVTLRVPPLAPAAAPPAGTETVREELLDAARGKIGEMRRRFQAQLTAMHTMYEQQLAAAASRAMDEEAGLTEAASTDREAVPPNYPAAGYVHSHEAKHGLAFDPPAAHLPDIQKPLFHTPAYDTPEPQEDLFKRRPSSIGALGTSLQQAGEVSALSASLARTSFVPPPPSQQDVAQDERSDDADARLLDVLPEDAESEDASGHSHAAAQEAQVKAEVLSKRNPAHQKDTMDDPAYGVRSDYDGEQLNRDLHPHKTHLPPAGGQPISPEQEEDIDEGAAFVMDEDLDDESPVPAPGSNPALGAGQGGIAARRPFGSLSQPRPSAAAAADDDDTDGEGYPANMTARGSISVPPSHRPLSMSLKPYQLEGEQRWLAARTNPRFGGGFSDTNSDAGDDASTASGPSTKGVAFGASVGAIAITKSRIGFRGGDESESGKRSGYERQPKTSLPLGEKRLVPPLMVNQARTKSGRRLPTIAASPSLSSSPKEDPLTSRIKQLNHFPVGESPRAMGRRPVVAQSMMPMVGSLTQRGFTAPFVRAVAPEVAPETPVPSRPVAKPTRPAYVRPPPPTSLSIRLEPNPADKPAAIDLFAVPVSDEFKATELAEDSTRHSEDMRRTLQFMHALFNLKMAPRTGWLHHRVPAHAVESISDHMYRMAVLALLLPEDDVDIGRCVQLALVHDMAEAEVGDLTPLDGVDKAEKERREREAIEHLVYDHLQSSPAGMRILTLWNEYEDRATPEARLVKDLDRFELALQAFEYERDYGITDLQPFYRGSVPYISHPRQRQWAAALAAERAEWWADNGHEYTQPTKDPLS